MTSFGISSPHQLVPIIFGKIYERTGVRESKSQSGRLSFAVNLTKNDWNKLMG
jgi:hypothetical protein